MTIGFFRIGRSALFRIRNLLGIGATLLCFFAAGMEARGDEEVFEATISPEIAFPGSVVQIRVSYSGSAQNIWLPSFEGPQGALVPERPQSSSSNQQIVNRKVSSNFTWIYMFEAEGSGMMDFGPVKLKTGDTTLSCELPPIRVIGGIHSSGGDALATLIPSAKRMAEGDVLSLRLTVSHVKARAETTPPDIFSNPEFAAIFRSAGDPVLESTNQGDALAFVYKVRPLKTGTLEVPAVSIPVFNVSTMEEDVVSTTPFPIRVIAEKNKSDAGVLLENDKKIPPALEATPGSLRPHQAPGLIGVWLPPCIFAGVVALLFIFRHVKKCVAFLASRFKRRDPVREIRSASSPQQAIAAVARALGVAKESVMPADIDQAMREAGTSQEIREGVTSLLQEAFDEAFRPGADARCAIEPRRGKLAALVEQMRRKAHLLVVALCATCALAAKSGDIGFEWHRALSAAATAKTEKDWEQVAGLYAEIARDGSDSAPLWRNFGTALLLAENPLSAADCYRRAEQLEGRTPETSAGLSTALDKAGLKRRWSERVFVWHVRMPLALREKWAQRAWLAAWILLAAAYLARKPFRGATRGLVALAIFATVIAIALGASAIVGERLVSAPVPSVQLEATE